MYDYTCSLTSWWDKFYRYIFYVSRFPTRICLWIEFEHVFYRWLVLVCSIFPDSIFFDDGISTMTGDGWNSLEKSEFDEIFSIFCGGSFCSICNILKIDLFDTPCGHIITIITWLWNWIFWILGIFEWFLFFFVTHWSMRYSPVSWFR